MLSAVIVLSCSKAPLQYAQPEYWYQSQTPYDSNKVDVIYFVSTNVLGATDARGNVAWRSQLTLDDKAAMSAELQWVEQNIFCSDFNMSAPYYHQFTFDSIWQLDNGGFSAVYQQVAAEACEAFDYYMNHCNNGRPYILAGFSQGAMLTLDVLKNMTDEQYSRMIVCYAIGYRLSAQDLEHPHIRAAQGADDCGVVVSFNSAQTREAVWPFVSEGAATCINPVSWTTDSTPASFVFDGTYNTVHADPATHTLLVDTDTPSYYHQYYDSATFFKNAGVSSDNLHHWDLLFYSRNLHDNALTRAQVQKRRP